MFHGRESSLELKKKKNNERLLRKDIPLSPIYGWVEDKVDALDDHRVEESIQHYRMKLLWSKKNIEWHKL